MATDVYRDLQVLGLILKWLVLWAFGFGIIAYQLKHKKHPTWKLWKMPGAYVGAFFLIIDGVLPLQMWLLRLTWLPYDLYSLPATLVIDFIAINSVLAFGRWWTQGFGDAPGPWDGRTPSVPYTGPERRIGPPERRADWPPTAYK